MLLSFPDFVDVVAWYYTITNGRPLFELAFRRHSLDERFQNVSRIYQYNVKHTNG